MKVLLTVSVLVLALAACGDGGSGPAAATTTPATLATLEVRRSDGIAGVPAELQLGPGDARLAAAAATLGLPLPASADTVGPAADAFVYEVTAVLTDGTAAAWRFDDAAVPADLAALHAWLQTTL